MHFINASSSPKGFFLISNSLYFPGKEKKNDPAGWALNDSLLIAHSATKFLGFPPPPGRLFGEQTLGNSACHVEDAEQEK